MSTAPAPALPARERLAALVASLEHGLLERSAAVRLALLSALAGEHVLLVGPPGTAKSELARRLHRAFAGARYFERLLTRFSTPEELFGPLSLKALEHDRYERLTDGYLPTASIAFLDEVFKANSAILNALLTLLNEREFDNGAGRARTPLISVVGATNEVPSEEGLVAFYDRFLIRVPVAPVSDASFAQLLALDDRAPPPAEPLARDEVAAWQCARDAVGLAPATLDALASLRRFAAAEQVPVSDRRWRQIVGLLRTAALTEGRTMVEPLDLWLAPFTVAQQPQQAAAFAQWFVREVAHAAPLEAPWLTRAVDAFEQQFEIESTLPPEQDDGEAGKLALARAITGPSAGTSGEGMLRIVSATLEDRLRQRFSRVHIDARVAQVSEVIGRASAHADALRADAARLDAALAGRLWLPPELAARMRDDMAGNVALVDALVARLDAVRAGFAALPVDEQAGADAAPPEPVALSA